MNTTPAIEYLNAAASNKISEEFSAPSDGVLFIWANRGYNGRSLIVKINNIEVVNYKVVENKNPLRKIISFKKGDLFNFSIVGNSSDEFIGVYYYE